MMAEIKTPGPKCVCQHTSEINRYLVKNVLVCVCVFQCKHRSLNKFSKTFIYHLNKY